PDRRTSCRSWSVPSPSRAAPPARPKSRRGRRASAGRARHIARRCNGCPRGRTEEGGCARPSPLLQNFAGDTLLPGSGKTLLPENATDNAAETAPAALLRLLLARRGVAAGAAVAAH